MLRYPTTIATIKPMLKTGRKLPKSGIFTRSSKESSPAASMIGIDIRNENLAAASRFNPRLKPPLIVAPEREIPGKIDSN